MISNENSFRAEAEDGSMLHRHSVYFKGPLSIWQYDVLHPRHAAIQPNLVLVPRQNL